MRQHKGDLDPIYLPVDEAYPLVGVGRSTFYKLMASGAVKTVKIGTRRLVSYESLRQLGEEAE